MLTPRFNGTARFDPSYGMGPGAMGFAGHMGPQGIYHVPTYMNEVSSTIPKLSCIFLPLWRAPANNLA